MKSKLRLAAIQWVFGFFLGSACALPAAAAVLSNVNVIIPYGDSQVEQYLGGPRYVGPMQVSYLPSPSCPTIQLQLEVRSAQTGTWYRLAYANGSFVPVADPIDTYRLRFSQYSFTSLTCNLTVSSLDDFPSPPPPPDPNPNPNPQPEPELEYNYLGRINFAGGPPQKVFFRPGTPVVGTFIFFDIPQSCPNLSVSQVFASGSGFSWAARPTYNGQELFALKQNTRFDMIQFTATGSPCPIDVYTY